MEVVDFCDQVVDQLVQVPFVLGDDLVIGFQEAFHFPALGLDMVAGAVVDFQLAGGFVLLQLQGEVEVVVQEDSSAGHDLDGSIVFFHNADIDEFAELLQAEVPFVQQLVESSIDGLAEDDFIVQLGQLAGNGVDLLDVGFQFLVDVIVVIFEPVVDIADNAGEGAGLFAQADPGRFAFRVDADVLPGIKKLAQIGVDALVPGFLEGHLDGRQGVFASFPVLLGSQGLAELVVVELAFYTGNIGNLHSIARGLRRTRNGRGNQGTHIHPLARVPFGVGIGNILTGHVSPSLLGVDGPASDFETSKRAAAAHNVPP